MRVARSLWSLFGVWRENTKAVKVDTRLTCTHSVSTGRPTQRCEPSGVASILATCLSSQQTTATMHVVSSDDISPVH